MTKREAERRAWLIDRAKLDYDDLRLIDRIHRMAATYHRMCENDCNGEGVVDGCFYRLDNPKGFLKDGETSKFTAKCERIEK